MSTDVSSLDIEVLFAGGGETGAAIRNHDWASTGLGPVEAWPSALHAIAGSLLHVPTPMAIAWGPGFLMIYNDAYRHLLDGRHPGALGQSFSECFSDQWPSLSSIFESVMSGRVHARADSRFRITYSPIPHGGGPAGILISLIDASGNELAAERIRHGEERLRLIVESSGAGTFEIDLRTQIITADARHHELAGAPLAGGATRSLSYAGVHPDDRERFERAIHAAVAGDNDGKLFVEIRTGGMGHVPLRWIEIRGQVIRSEEGRPLRLVGTSFDITARKESEAAREALLAALKESIREAEAARALAETASRAMDEFLATVSHELRTPLTAMLGWTRLLRSGQVAEGQRPKALETIERNATAQAQLIEDLLDVSRIISGKMRLDVVAVDLVAVIEAALDVVKPAADAKGVRLSPFIDPSAGHVTGDSARLQQVVWNLLSNAVKFTPKGGRVEIRLARAGSSVEIAVTDTGAGIPRAFLPHVFERFRQANGAITRSYGGLGLGLAIVKSIVELHGGTVRATSEGADHGSSFVARLPLALVRPLSADSFLEQHPRIERTVPFECPPEVNGLSVLVVDDEEDARELLAAILERCGAIVTTAPSVAEALARIETSAPKVIVSDIGMPDEDGYSLIGKLRARSPEAGGRIPAIALTAYARAEDRTRALRSGFNTHLAKPIEPSELLAVIASVVARTTGF